jgi:hypothetical protein
MHLRIRAVSTFGPATNKQTVLYTTMCSKVEGLNV